MAAGVALSWPIHLNVFTARVHEVAKGGWTNHHFPRASAPYKLVSDAAACSGHRLRA